MNRLKGKVVLVTGAAQGIGHAVAELFAAEGAVVYAGDIHAPKAGSALPGVTYVDLDVSEAEDWKRVVADITSKQGRIDVLVNNAGIVLDYSQVHETKLENWTRVVAVNQTGTFLGMREVVPIMKQQGGGSIINFSSIWGNVGVAGAAAYHATKGAVRNLTKHAAISYAADNIRVNSVHPGLIWTPLIDAQSDEMNAGIVAVTPLGRMGKPVEVAYGCVFLASDEASFVTGAELAIDGGYLAQ